MALAKNKIVFIVLLWCVLGCFSAKHYAYAMDNKINGYAVFTSNSPKSFFSSKVSPLLSLSKKNNHFPYAPDKEKSTILPQRKPVLEVEVKELAEIKVEELADTTIDENKESNNVVENNLIKGAFFEELRKDSSLIKLAPLDFVLIDDKTLEMSVVDYSLKKIPQTVKKDAKKDKDQIPIPIIDLANAPLPPLLPPFRQPQKDIAKDNIFKNDRDKSNEIELLVAVNNNDLKEEVKEVLKEEPVKLQRSIIPIKRPKIPEDKVLSNVVDNKKEIITAATKVKETALQSGKNEEVETNVETVVGSYLLPKKPQKIWLSSDDDFDDDFDDKLDIRTKAELDTKLEMAAKIDIPQEKPKENRKNVNKKISEEDLKIAELPRQVTLKAPSIEVAPIIKQIHKKPLQKWEDRIGLEKTEWQPVIAKDLLSEEEIYDEYRELQFVDVGGVKMAPIIPSKKTAYGEKLKPVKKVDRRVENRNSKPKISKTVNRKTKTLEKNIFENRQAREEIKEIALGKPEISDVDTAPAFCDLCDEYANLDFESDEAVNSVPIIRIKDIAYEEFLSPANNTKSANKQSINTYDEHLEAKKQIEKNIEGYRSDDGDTLLANLDKGSNQKQQPLLQPITGDDMPVFSFDGSTKNEDESKQGGNDIVSSSFMNKLSSLFGSAGAATPVSANYNAGTLEQQALAEKKLSSAEMFVEPKELLKKQAVNTGPKKESKVLPSEIRLSFVPGDAEISGNTVSLINRLAENVISDRTFSIEIRMAIDYAGELQTKRYALIQNILLGNGVYSEQLFPIFSSRPKDTIVLRTVKNDKARKVTERAKNKKYINW